MSDYSGTATPDAAGASATPGSLNRLASFRVTYIAVATFLLLYIFSVKGAELLLEPYFQQRVAEAIEIDSYFTPAAQQIKANLERMVERSAWVDFWNVEVNVIVLGNDGTTWLYVDGHIPPASPDRSAEALMREAQRLLPATGEVVVSVPHNTLLSNSILVAYAAILFQFLFLYNRRIAKRDDEILGAALASRDEAARKAEGIAEEIERVRERLMAVEPAEREQREEITSLQREREELEAQLARLSNRERELRGKAEQAVQLDQERAALESLLDEASGDLEAKDDEIRELERNLKRATRSGSGGAGGSRSRETETLGKRLRTLYKNVEVDDRAIQDIIALRDEGTKLRAEECIKRLSEEADNLALRRKVGGLPNHLNIYELGFAGKRRLYYMRGQQRRFRVLVIGAKNTQQADLDYMARIPKSDVA